MDLMDGQSISSLSVLLLQHCLLRQRKLVLPSYPLIRPANPLNDKQIERQFAKQCE